MDLTTADPLAMAEAGNATLFVKDVELLDTMTPLIPFTANGDAAYTSDPLYIIDQSLGVLNFDGFIGGNPPAIKTKPISFTSAASLFGPAQVVTGDFNGDGKLDAVTLNGTYPESACSRTVSAMLVSGDGMFAAPVQTNVGSSALNMVAGDFNGDTKLDLAVLEGTQNTGYHGYVQLFDGNGDGTFTAGPMIDVGADLDESVIDKEDFVAADMNGDGKPDLVIATSAGVAILLGNGHGGFTTSPTTRPCSTRCPPAPSMAMSPP